MSTYTAHITPRDGIARAFALIAFGRAEALAEARRLGREMFGASFTYLVRAQ